jgi:hypothetical protein
MSLSSMGCLLKIRQSIVHLQAITRIKTETIAKLCEPGKMRLANVDYGK